MNSFRRLSKNREELLIGAVNVHQQRGCRVGGTPIGILMQRTAQSPTNGKDEADEARLLCSFAPALMLTEMEKDGAAIQPPTTHDYVGIALFAVCSGHRAPICMQLLATSRPTHAR